MILLAEALDNLSLLLGRAWDIAWIHWLNFGEYIQTTFFEKKCVVIYTENDLQMFSV